MTCTGIHQVCSFVVRANSNLYIDVVQSATISLVVPNAGNYLLCANATSSRCNLHPVPYWFYQNNNYSVVVCWDKYPTICGTSQTPFSVIGINIVPLV